MTDTNHNGSSFLFGALIGGGIVFLLGTKKGKQLLKVITEEGLDGIANIGDIVEDVEDEYEDQGIIENNPVVEEVKKTEQVVKEELIEQKPTGVKRFFKGTRKK